MSTGPSFAFDHFELDPVRRRLTASGEPVAVTDRQLDILIALVSRAGQIVAKDDLIEAAWRDVAVGDNSLEQAISSLRRLLAAHAGAAAYIETVPRRGYRLSVDVTRRTRRESDVGLDALLAPHRAFVEGRAALETLEGDQIPGARASFEEALRSVPDHASAHLGLANACVMQFEMTRTDPAPDVATLQVALVHAREACRLDPGSGEAWATLGFVLDRIGEGRDAVAAAQRAVTLEPDNWRHHFRLAFVTWGETRLRAAQRTLALLPHFPLAHWLAATVHIARQALGEAERELTAAIQAAERLEGPERKFNAVAIHWLLGLVHLARGDDRRARDAFDRELAGGHGTHHLYARECRGNTWHAIGALALRHGQREEAATAFAHALDAVATHPLARVGLAASQALPHTRPPWPSLPDRRTGSPALAVEVSLYRAATLVMDGRTEEAAHLVADALSAAPAGNAGWILPVEPILNVGSDPQAWAPALTRLRNRAA